MGNRNYEIAFRIDAFVVAMKLANLFTRKEEAEGEFNAICVSRAKGEEAFSMTACQGTDLFLCELEALSNEQMPLPGLPHRMKGEQCFYIPRSCVEAIIKAIPRSLDPAGEIRFCISQKSKIGDMDIDVSWDGGSFRYQCEMFTTINWRQIMDGFPEKEKAGTYIPSMEVNSMLLAAKVFKGQRFVDFQLATNHFAYMLTSQESPYVMVTAVVLYEGEEQPAKSVAMPETVSQSAQTIKDVISPRAELPEFTPIQDAWWWHGELGEEIQREEALEAV